MSLMGSFMPPVVIEVTASVAEAMAKLEGVNAELAKMEAQSLKTGASLSTLEKTGAAARGALLAIGAAGVAAMGLAVKAAMDEQVAMERLNVALTNVNQNTAANRAVVDAQIASMQKLGFVDDAVINSFGSLVTATGSVTKSQSLMALAADVARYRHVSLEDATQSLIKATAGNARAFKDFGITLDANLPKQQAINKAIDELNKKVHGQADEYTKTFSGQLQVLGATTENVAQMLGNALLPALTLVTKIFVGAVTWIKENKTALEMLGAVVLTAVTAWKTYEVTLVAVNAIQKVQIALALASAEGIGKLRAMQLLLNDAMKANLIGVIVTGLTILSAAFVMAWNHSETFRKVVVTALQMVIDAVGYLIGAFGSLVKAATHIPVIGNAFKGVSDFINNAANEVRKFGDGLDKLKNKTVTVDTKVKSDTFNPNLDYANINPKDTAAAKLASQNKKYVDEAVALQKSLADKVQNYNDAIASANAKFQDATTTAQNDFNNQMGDLNAKYAQDQADLLVSHLQKMQDIKDANSKAMQDEEKRHTDAMAKIQSDYANKLQSIIQKSIDEMVNAFKSATSVNIGTIFSDLEKAGDTSGAALITSLTDKLNKAKQLATDAAKLASAGFSQQFIDQVISQGPEIGDKMTQAILTSTPDQIKQMQDLYAELDNVSNNGVTDLAKTMSDGQKFANQQLANEYKQTQKDLVTALAEETKTYNEKMLELSATLQSTLAKEEDAYQTSLSKLTETYNASMTKLEETRDAALAKAHDDLVKATDAAQKTLSEALGKIESDFVKKLGNIKSSVFAVTDAITQLKIAMATATTSTGGYGITPLGTSPVNKNAVTTGTSQTNTTNNNFNVPVTVLGTETSTGDIQQAVISGIKYGAPIVVQQGVLPTGVNPNSTAGRGALLGILD